MSHSLAGPKTGPATGQRPTTDKPTTNELGQHHRSKLSLLRFRSFLQPIAVKHVTTETYGALQLFLGGRLLRSCIISTTINVVGVFGPTHPGRTNTLPQGPMMLSRWSVAENSTRRSRHFAGPTFARHSGLTGRYVPCATTDPFYRGLGGRKSTRLTRTVPSRPCGDLNRLRTAELK